MKKRSINPFNWHWADDQGVLIEGAHQTLYVSGQTAMSDDGEPMYPNDMRAQAELTLDNIAKVLAEAGMDFSNIVTVNTYVTEMDKFKSEAAEYMDSRFAEYNVSPPGVLSGVTALGHPDLIIEIAVTAVR